MAGNKVAKPIGARRLTWVPILTEPENAAPTYGEAVKLSRMINITRTPIFAEGTLESDDGEEENTALILGYDVGVNASQMTDTIRAALLGHQMDTGGGMLTRYTDEGPYGALVWEELLSKEKPSDPDKYKKIVLYKGRFREFAETANTLTTGGITYQTHNLTGRFIKRNDGALSYTMREDTPDASATKLAAWFDEPQEFGPAPTENGGS